MLAGDRRTVFRVTVFRVCVDGTSRVHAASVALRMRLRSAYACAAAIVLVTGCGLPLNEDMDLAQTVYDMGEVVQGLQQSQAELNDRIDSLTMLVTRQDSTLRALANLSGNPLPPR